MVHYILANNYATCIENHPFNFCLYIFFCVLIDKKIDMLLVLINDPTLPFFFFFFFFECFYFFSAVDCCGGRGEPLLMGAAAGLSLQGHEGVRHDGCQTPATAAAVARTQSRQEGK